MNSLSYLCMTEREKDFLKTSVSKFQCFQFTTFQIFFFFPLGARLEKTTLKALFSFLTSEERRMYDWCSALIKTSRSLSQQPPSPGHLSPEEGPGLTQGFQFQISLERNTALTAPNDNPTSAALTGILYPAQYPGILTRS